MPFFGNTNEQLIAEYLREAQALRRIAAVLSLRRARAKVLQSAIEFEQRAVALQMAQAADPGLAPASR